MEPLFRWYGGKRSRITHMFFPSFEEYREPFVGGGAVFFHLCPAEGWINDLDVNISNVFSVIRDAALCKTLAHKIINADYPTRETHQARGERVKAFAANGGDRVPDIEAAFDFLVAIKFCSRARIYGGKIGFDHWIGKKQNYRQFNRFQYAKRVVEAHKVLSRTRVSCVDFEELIRAEGENVFIYLDPPYVGTKGSEGINYSETGDLHDRLAAALKETKHQFLLSYEDNSEIRRAYAWANVRPLEGSYASRRKNKGVTELLIANY